MDDPPPGMGILPVTSARATRELVLMRTSSLDEKGRDEASRGGSEP